MNREIKFRAWDTVDKVIRTVTSINWFDECVEMDEHPNGEYVRRKLSEVVLLQSTGLKDKNGKEIYEGDIIQDEVSSSLVVEWDNFSWSVKISEGLYMKFDSLEEEEIKIIGNIYQNSELINN